LESGVLGRGFREIFARGGGDKKKKNSWEVATEAENWKNLRKKMLCGEKVIWFKKSGQKNLKEVKKEKKRGGNLRGVQQTVYETGVGRRKKWG